MPAHSPALHAKDPELPWLPTAPCTSRQCMTEAVPTVGRLHRVARYAALLGMAVAGVVLYPVVRRWFPARLRDRVTRAWARALAHACGVRVRINGSAAFGSAVAGAEGLGAGVADSGAEGAGSAGVTGARAAGSGVAGSGAVGAAGVAGAGGTGTGVTGPAVAGAAVAGPPATGSATRAPTSPPASAGVLIVANHISWLDIPLLAAVRPGRMLAKKEVGSYPVLGRLAARGGRTLFVDRDRLRALPGTVAEMAAALRAGSAVVAFPEGSTWCGRGQGRFRHAVFQAALDARVPVQPVAIRYRLHGAGAGGTAEPTTVPAFIGDDTLLSSLHRVIAVRGLVAEVTVLPAIAPGTHPCRRTLARAAQTAQSATGIPAPAPAPRRPRPAPAPASAPQLTPTS